MFFFNNFRLFLGIIFMLLSVSVLWILFITYFMDRRK